MTLLLKFQHRAARCIECAVITLGSRPFEESQAARATGSGNFKASLPCSNRSFFARRSNPAPCESSQFNASRAACETRTEPSAPHVINCKLLAASPPFCDTAKAPPHCGGPYHRASDGGTAWPSRRRTHLAPPAAPSNTHCAMALSAPMVVKTTADAPVAETAAAFSPAPKPPANIRKTDVRWAIFCSSINITSSKSQTHKEPLLQPVTSKALATVPWSDSDPRNLAAAETKARHVGGDECCRVNKDSSNLRLITSTDLPCVKATTSKTPDGSMQVIGP
mmetsp:Transcript_5867/g.18650  ORF Transcript_5867/g.18650 Transcript_5867/m.18650 type:complete len:279 (+) Transcript_5867:1832-2668(+)